MLTLLTFSKIGPEFGKVDPREWLRPASARRALQQLMFVLAASATAVSAADATSSQPTRPGRAGAPIIGVFTGEFERGAPIYRLPSITVIAKREVGLAKRVREEQGLRARGMRAKPATAADLPSIANERATTGERGHSLSFGGG